MRLAREHTHTPHTHFNLPYGAIMILKEMYAQVKHAIVCSVFCVQKCQCILDAMSKLRDYSSDGNLYVHPPSTQHCLDIMKYQPTSAPLT